MNSQVYLNLNTEEFWVNGKVTSEDGSGGKLGIAFVNVIIADTKIGTQTDIEGNFRLLIPKNIKNPVLIFSSVGYETQEHQASKNMQLSMEENIVFFDGAITVGRLPKNRIQAVWWHTKHFMRFRWLRR